MLLMLASFAGNSVFAYQDDYIISRAEERQFTRQNVTSISQDAEGFIWFGTESGLFRHNAHSIEPLQSDVENPVTIPGNNIRDIYNDPKGNLWVISQHSGLSRYHSINQSFQTFIPVKYDSGRNNDRPFGFEKVHGDANPYLWLIPDSGPNIYRFDTEEETFIEIEINFQNRRTDNNILSIKALPNDEIWVGTSHSGIIILNPEGEEINRISVTDSVQQQETNLSFSVETMAEDEGRVWIGTYSGGIFYYDLEQEIVVKPESLQVIQYEYRANIYDIHIDDMGMVWAGTDDGLLLYDPELMEIQYQFIHDPINFESLVNNRIRVIYQDNSGLLWVGNEYGGVHNLQRKHAFISINNGAQSPVRIIGDAVRAFSLCDKNRLWVAVDNEGIYVLDYETFELIDNINHDPDDPNSISVDGATRFLHDPDGGIWIGTWGGGLNYYDPETGNFTRYLNESGNPASIPDNRVQVLFIDSSGRFWVGTENGLALFDPDSGRFEKVFNDPLNPPVLSHQALQSLAFIEDEDEEGVLWIGTWDGLNRYDSANHTIKHYRVDYHHPNSLRSNRILSLYDDGDGTLWIGTWGGGLSRMSKETGQIKTYTQIDGLGNNVVFAILPDKEGFLWLSTSNGLSRMNPQTGFFVTYTRQDGITSDEFWWGSAYAASDGRLMFGGTYGFTIFDPAEITERQYELPVRISSVRVYDQPVFPDSDHNLELGYRDNLLTFEFAALDFANANRIEYAYMLEGVDRDWNYSGNRNYATYSFLRGGDYTFHVRATDNYGVWQDEIALLYIRIQPPVWQRLWFQFVIIGLILFGIWLFIRNRSRQMERRNQKLEAEVAARTKDLAEKQKELLARNKQLEVQTKQLMEQKEEIESQKETILQKTHDLERINKNLVDLNEDKNNLIGLVSHDLRAPLATVLGTVKLFKSDHNLTKEQQIKMFEMLEEMMQKQLKMVSNILDIDSIESGKIHILKEPVDVVEITNDVIARYHENAVKKGIKLKVETEEEEVIIRADKSFLSDQIFGNLISNALKFSPGKSEVEVIIQKNQKVLRWGIKDQGPGLSDKDMKKLFGKYQKLSARPTAGEASTGLGLSIVKKFVEEMDGKVWCESEHGNGALFWVEFPLNDPKSQQN